MKNFIIGDIHGHYSELKELLNLLNPNFKNDKLIFLGDYIDRGPQSYDVVQLLINLQEKHGDDKVVLLRGNHEQMAMENIKTGYIDYFNGYDITFRDFKINKDSIENYYELFNRLPLIYEDKSFICVHGGIRPGVKMEDQYPSDLLWIREEFYESSKNFIKPIIFGHTPTLHIGICQDSCHNSFKFFKTMKHPQYSLLYPQLCLQFYPQFFLFSLDLKTPYPLMTNF